MYKKYKKERIKYFCNSEDKDTEGVINNIFDPEKDGFVYGLLPDDYINLNQFEYSDPHSSNNCKEIFPADSWMKSSSEEGNQVKQILEQIKETPKIRKLNEILTNHGEPSSEKTTNNST